MRRQLNVTTAAAVAPAAFVVIPPAHAMPIGNMRHHLQPEHHHELLEETPSVPTSASAPYEIVTSVASVGAIVSIPPL
jgi:hypothetical protein